MKGILISKAKRLKRITENESLESLRQKARPGEPYMRTLRAAGISGAQHGVAWHRGRQCGIAEVIVTLRELSHPRIAKKLMTYYDMNEDGSITL